MSNEEERQVGAARHIVVQEQTREEFQKKIDEAVARGAHFFPESFQYVWIPRVSARVYLGIIKIPSDAI